MWGLPVLRGSIVSLCMGLALAAGTPELGQEQEVEAFSTWAEIQVREQHVKASPQLLVKNSASSAVRLANCVESHTVPAGGNVSLKLEGLAVFWVLPEQGAWDCRAGPFDFYIDANFTGPQAIVGVGFGLVFNQSKMPEGPSQEEEPPASAMGSGNMDEEEADKVGGDKSDGGDSEGGYDVIGLELAATGAPAATEGGNSRVVARCAAGLCGEGHEVQAMPAGFTLTIVGSQNDGGWHQYRHGHGHWGRWGRRYGHRWARWGRRGGWRRYRWGYGRRGWRRGGWHHGV